MKRDEHNKDLLIRAKFLQHKVVLTGNDDSSSLSQTQLKSSALNEWVELNIECKRKKNRSTNWEAKRKNNNSLTTLRFLNGFWIFSSIHFFIFFLTTSNRGYKHFSYNFLLLHKNNQVQEKRLEASKWNELSSWEYLWKKNKQNDFVSCLTCDDGSETKLDGWKKFQLIQLDLDSILKACKKIESHNEIKLKTKDLE
jgi:hypothetical protein